MSGRRLAVLIGILLVLALLLQLRRAQGLAQVGLTLARVERESLAAAATNRFSPALFERNQRDLERATKLAPAEVLVPIQRAGQYVLRRRPEAAIRAYHEALALEPRAEIYRHLGQVHWNLGELEQAREAFRRAVLLDHTLRRELLPFLPTDLQRGERPLIYQGFEGPWKLGGALLPEQLLLEEDFESGQPTLFNKPGQPPRSTPAVDPEEESTRDDQR